MLILIDMIPVRIFLHPEKSPDYFLCIFLLALVCGAIRVTFLVIYFYFFNYYFFGPSFLSFRLKIISLMLF